MEKNAKQAQLLKMKLEADEQISRTGRAGLHPPPPGPPRQLGRALLPQRTWRSPASGHPSLPQLMLPLIIH